MRMVQLAARNLTRNRRRTAISLVALAICFAAMVIFRGFINGQQQVMLENFVRGQVGMVQVHRAGYLANVQGSPLQLDFADTPELREKVLAVKGVTALSPRINFGAMVSMPDSPAPPGSEEPVAGKTSFLLMTGIDPSRELAVAPKRKEWLGQGRLPSAASGPDLVLNADFASAIGAPIVDPSKPLPPETQWPALLAADRDGALNGANVVLVGTQVSAAPGDRKVGLVPLETAQQLLRMEGRVTEYALSLESLSDIPRVVTELRATLGPEYEVHAWYEVLPFIHELMANQEFIFSLVSMVFVVVVLLGIVNVMLMNVLERVREIGTMMAIGVRRRQIVSMFLTEGAVLGLLGAAVGAVVGMLVVAWLHRRGIYIPAPGSEIDMVIRPFVEPGYLGFVLLLASVGSAVAAVYPSYRASRLRPVEALQKT